MIDKLAELLEFQIKGLLERIEEEATSAVEDSQEISSLGNTAHKQNLKN
jgi:hypothetical protein